MCWTLCARDAAHCPMHQVTAATNRKLPNGGLGKRLTELPAHSEGRTLRVQVIKLRDDHNCHISIWGEVVEKYGCACWLNDPTSLQVHFHRLKPRSLLCDPARSV